MTLDEIQVLLQRAAAHPRAHFVGPRPPELLASAERRLGLVFPPAYRLFVQQLGAGSVGGFEVYGIIDADLTGIPDAVWITMDERQNHLPATGIIIGSTGDGNYYVIDVSVFLPDGDAQVQEWDAADGRFIDGTKTTFGAYFSAGIAEDA